LQRSLVGSVLCIRDSDRVGRAGEPRPDGAEELLTTVMEDGRRVGAMPTLDAARARCRASLAALPPECLRLENPGAYPVDFTEALLALGRELAERLGGLPPAPSAAAH
jgi:nicotinate phosphoribosyltransferase